MKAFHKAEVERIRKQVGSGKVICGLSGGVDSAVTAVLVHEAVGDQLTCIFVDTGLMRLNEGAEVVELFRKTFKIPLVSVDASARFLAALKDVREPESKRKIIGKLFIDVFEEEARKIGDAKFLAQGTVYPDIIESTSAAGATIKSHHNVGGLPERMNMELIEPLREFYKEDVRTLGRELSLPDHFIKRHPFPGPGLAIRVLGAVDKKKLDLLRKADAIYLDEIRKAGLYDKIWQAFAILLDVRSVGTKADQRSYDHVLTLRAVTSDNAMTAEAYPLDHDFLTRVSARLIQEVPGINRVVYDVTSKPPGTIEWE